jgi:starch synthase
MLCQEYEYPRFDVAACVGRRLRLPVFATFQGGDWQTSRIERWLRPRTLKAAAGLIIPTNTEAARVRTHYGVSEAKVARIFNPLDLGAWSLPDRRRARRDLGFAASAEIVVWHGRVDMHRKGLDVLLDAWEGVMHVRSGHAPRLLLIGTGASAGELRARVEADASIRWIDEYVLDRDRLRRLLAAADVYAFPSRHEGFPVALVEALAAGLPVVAADAPGVPDILGPDPACGVIVPRGDVAAFARALGDLLDAPERAAMGRAARQRAEAAFALDTVGAQLKAFLFPDI